MATNWAEVLQDTCIFKGCIISPDIVNTAEAAYRKKKALLEQQEAATKNRQSTIAFSIIALAMITIIVTLIINRK